MSTPVEEVRLSLPHIELAAHLFGPEDGLPVIALHGWLDNANSFARLAPKLQGLRIIALDMAGHGHSAHRPTGAGYALWDYVFDVLQVAEQLGWKRFALLGHSLGAIVSLVLAGALPERVTHLGLIDGAIPPTGTADNAAERLGMALQAQLALPDNALTLAAGEQVNLGSAQQQVTEVTADDIEVKLSWRQGNLIFRGESLEEAVKEIGRYTSVEFIFINEDLKKTRVAGMFNAVDVEGLLATLRENFNIVSERDGVGNVLLNTK